MLEHQKRHFYWSESLITMVLFLLFFCLNLFTMNNMECLLSNLGK